MLRCGLGFTFFMMVIFSLPSSLQAGVEDELNPFVRSQFTRGHNPNTRIKMRKRAYDMEVAEEHQSLQLGAIFMLVHNWKVQRNDRKCNFNNSISALADKWRPNNPYPIILMDTKPWSRDDMVAIKRTWTTLDFKFINIAKSFYSQLTIEASTFLDAQKPLSGIGYKRMCQFFFSGFTQVPFLMKYKYLLRLDDDTCLLDHINNDLFALMEKENKAYGFSTIWYDLPFVTMGMESFMKDFMQRNQFEYRNVRLHDITFMDNRTRIAAFNTNFEVINTISYRTNPRIQLFVEEISQKQLIFHYRWGDAPLRLMTAQIAWKEEEIMRLDGFEYQHSTWRPFTLVDVKDQDLELYTVHIAAPP